MITFSMSLYHERLGNSNITFENDEINLFLDNWNLLGCEKNIIAFEGWFLCTWCFRAFVLFCLNCIFIKSKITVWSLIIIKLKSDKKNIRILMFCDNMFKEKKVSIMLSKLILNPIRGFIISKYLVNTLICVMLQIMLRTPILFQYISHNDAFFHSKLFLKSKKTHTATFFQTTMVLLDIFLPCPVYLSWSIWMFKDYKIPQKKRENTLYWRTLQWEDCEMWWGSKKMLCIHCVWNAEFLMYRQYQKW